MKKTLILITSLLMLSCTSDDDFAKGKRQLQNIGYTNVRNTGYKIYCCSEGDYFSTGFSAVHKDGTKVKGCFCSSFLKGITIRYE